MIYRIIDMKFSFKHFYRYAMLACLAIAICCASTDAAFAQKKQAKGKTPATVKAPSFESIKSDPTHTRIYTLSNGLKVYMSVTKKEPRIQTYIAVRTGSKNDPHETTGLSHYLEHLMFKGTKSFGTVNYEKEKPLLDRIENEYEYYRTLKDPEARKKEYARIDSISYQASKYFVANEYDKMMAAIGSKNSNAFTSFDMTVYQEDIPSNQMEAWAKIQSDRFENMVIRGFHTELEAVYEEENLGLTDDEGKSSDTLLFALFKNHPYGLQTTIGTQEHLKNPSIKNIKNHFNNFYAPNNVAICMAGDFNPDEAIKVIEKYFGDWKRNDNLKLLSFEDEQPIEKHIEKTVYGQQAPFVSIGMRFPADYRDGKKLSNITDTLYVLGQILCNGKAGLFDSDINNKQKCLRAIAYNYNLTDYSLIGMEGYPKEGQSLAEVKNLMLGEIDKVKSGDFDASLLTAIVNNYKKHFMRSLESYQSRAAMQFESFISRTPWSFSIGEAERIAKISKEDIVKFAQRNFKDNYVVVNKITGVDKNIKKIEKPAITAILTNRDTSSMFLRDVQKMASAAKPIQPVFVDFTKDMTRTVTPSGQEFLYKKNDDNSLFMITYRFANGSNDNNKLNFAIDYFNRLGTDKISSDEFNMKMYTLASSFNANASENDIYVGVSGLAENIKETLSLIEDKFAGVKGDEEILKNMKSNAKKEMADAKSDKDENSERLKMYVIYGEHNSETDRLSPEEIDALTSEELLDIVKNLFSYNHTIAYYGPAAEKEAVAEMTSANKSIGKLKEFAPSKKYAVVSSSEPAVYVAPYKATQIDMYGISNTGEKFDLNQMAVRTLYDTYFGAGMSSIVFQDMREAKGLAYHASARFSKNNNENGRSIYYQTVIYTQNDKMFDAMKAFDDILTNMPVSQKSFDVAKSNVIQNIETKRFTGADILMHYMDMKEIGLDHSYYKDLYDGVKKLNLDSIVNFQKNNIKNRSYHIGILGDTDELNFKGIDESKYGKIVRLTTEQIFGY